MEKMTCETDIKFVISQLRKAFSSERSQQMEIACNQLIKTFDSLYKQLEFDHSKYFKFHIFAQEVDNFDSNKIKGSEPDSTMLKPHNSVEFESNVKPLGLSYLPRNLKPEYVSYESLSNILSLVYMKQKQSKLTYGIKLELRQRIYLLLTRFMSETIDLYLIGSSLTNMGSNACDIDLCLIIYDSNDLVDKKYEEKTEAMVKLHEISEILKSNGITTDIQVIPAMVPILKFTEKENGIEVNININRLITIRNTHLLHTYSCLDQRVSPLVLTIKLWARKNGINCAFNKSLTSYSISLMVIYFLQRVCQPEVVPCLQSLVPHLFTEDVTKLKLNDAFTVQFISRNNQSLGQLFSQFIEYFSFTFPYNKVISVRTASLMDRCLMTNTGKHWQWRCHVCIEEPFDGSNASHSVHDCKMFRNIINSFIECYQALKNGTLNLEHFI